MKKTEMSYTGWYFLGIVGIIYVICALLNKELVIEGLKTFIKILQNMILPLILVFILLVLTTYLAKPKWLVKHLGKESGAKGWSWSIVGGIISTGPIYLWYPLLNELQKQGVRDGYISAFLYNRAIKPALLPLFIVYFGLAYTIVLTIVMLITSIAQGVLIEKIMEVRK